LPIRRVKNRPSGFAGDEFEGGRGRPSVTGSIARAAALANQGHSRLAVPASKPLPRETGAVGFYSPHLGTHCRRLGGLKPIPVPGRFSAATRHPPQIEPTYLSSESSHCLARATARDRSTCV